MADEEKNEKSPEEKLKGAQVALNKAAKDREALVAELKSAQEALANSEKTCDDLRAENNGLRADLKSAAAKLEALQASKPPALKLDPNAPLIAKTRIHTGPNEAIEIGHPLTFDPKNPPRGFDGFVEGVHYERARKFIPST